MTNHNKFEKPVIVGSLFLASCLLCVSSNASLLSNSTLSFEAGVTSCSRDEGTFPNCTFGSAVTGSYMGFDTNADGVVNPAERAAMEQAQGLSLGVVQDLGKIDNQWEHITGFGQHFLSSEVTILSDDGIGNVKLDFSGWNLNFIFKDTTFGAESYNLGAGNLSFSNETGIASLTCDSNCSNGDGFVLDYSVHTLSYTDEGNSFPDTQYQLHLEGTISAVPLPAAFWLFSTGLVTFFGISRYRPKHM